jgi:hypothetical protein
MACCEAGHFFATFFHETKRGAGKTSPGASQISFPQAKNRAQSFGEFVESNFRF